MVRRTQPRRCSKGTCAIRWRWARLNAVGPSASATIWWDWVANRRGFATHRPPGRLVSVGNHRLHLDCAGSGGPTVVFESALGGWSIDWALVQPRVAAMTTACMYDRAGYGWSDPAHHRY